jgi:hypothetical protein
MTSCDGIAADKAPKSLGDVEAAAGSKRSKKWCTTVEVEVEADG